MKYCPQCVKELNPDDRFCIECGFDTLALNEPGNAHVQVPMDTTASNEPLPFTSTVSGNSDQYLQNSRNSTSSSATNKRQSVRWILICLVCVVVLGGGGWLTYTQLLTDQPVENSAKVIPPTNIMSVQAKEVNSQFSDTGKKIAFVYTVNAGGIEAEKQSSLKSVREEYKGTNPDGATRLVIKRPSVILKIITDHHNDGNGTANVGSITITGVGGMVVGTFKARGRAGRDGTTNGKWVAEPQIRLEPGVYYIQDSEPSTWSKNEQDVGLLDIEGYEI